MQSAKVDTKYPKPKLSIIIPAYKEAALIKKTIIKLKTFLASRRDEYGLTEVIIAVGKSPDNTLQVARQATAGLDHFKVVDAGDQFEKGHNVNVGMQHALGDKKVYMDADLATPLHHLDRTVSLLDKYDVVNGQRDLNTIHGGQPHRQLISKMGNSLVRLVLLPGFSDTQCGFKGFKGKVATKLFSKQAVKRWGFDMEILALAKNQGASIKQMPIKDWQDMEGGVINESPIKAIKAALHTLVDLFRIRFMLLTGYYR